MLPVPIITVDNTNQIIFANTPAERLFGYTREELTGATTDMLFASRGPAATHVEERGFARTAAGEATAHSLIGRRRDGVSLAAEAETTKFCIADQVLQIIAISVRSPSPEVARDPKELTHLARVSALGELAGSLAHELKQPLTAILFNAQAAKKFVDSPTPNIEELREALEDIVADNCRATHVIQKIRGLVRKGDIELQLLDVGSIVRDVALLVHSESLARGISTNFDIAENLALVCCEGVQFQQVFLNLLLNAFDAVRECDPAHRRIEAIVCEEPEGYVHITVKDCGAGLSVENLAKIFQPFFTTKPQGLGLGLSISRTIVTAHQGRLWAENNEGNGAAFHVELPCTNSVRHRTASLCS